MQETKKQPERHIERLAVEHMGHRGDGVAPTPIGPIFIPYALPGERVEVEIKGERGEIISILEPSADRIEPICPHFGTCGGCAVQHWQSDKYREWKRELKEVNEALWSIEDRIREKEAQAEFDQEFIELARSVYRTNDQRARIKRDINLSLGSRLIEEKQYKG